MKRGNYPKVDKIGCDTFQTKKERENRQKKKAKSFPVKFCPDCKRVYEDLTYLKEFPSLGLERRICWECRK
jgi:hypothetical protein